MNFKNVAKIIATWGGAGYLPWAPGTWGTLAALPFGIFAMLIFSYSWFLISILVIFILGVWSSYILLADSVEDDPGYIVVDEAVGVWIALIPTNMDYRYWILAFVLFRLFDIAKPWPIGWLDQNIKGTRLVNAFGVMIDDVLAGIFTAICIFFLSIFM